MNKHKTSNLGKLWKILPYRRKMGGRTPGMSSKAMQSRDGELDTQWVHKVKSVTREQLMEIIGRCTEIAIRAVFENFTYNFGGKIFLQLFGGPIGARLTMACSRIVMQEWGMHYTSILKSAGMEVTLLKIYVDDVRQATTTMRKGMRFSEGELTWSEEAEQEDSAKQQEGESDEARMVRVLTPAANSINPDLRFTSELEEDFEDNKLPTLDFKIWLGEDFSIFHTYFEKAMRTQLLIPKRSAMPQRQKMNIQTNELNRRLSNIDDRLGVEEQMLVTDHFTAQLKNSGYSRAGRN